MMKSVVAFILILFTVHSEVVIENPCQTMLPREKDKNWGEGAYFLPDTFNLPLSVYIDTLGKKFGVLKWGYLRESFKFLGEKEVKVRELYKNNVEQIGNTKLLMVRKCEDPRYLQILYMNGDSILYVKEEDLIEEGASYFTYKEYLIEKELPQQVQQSKENSNVGVNLRRSCLNLRMEPNLDSEIIHCIRGNDWPSDEFKTTHLKMLEAKSDWVKVESTTFVMGPFDLDCPSKVQSKHTGWVKAIDDNGFPNIWFAIGTY